MIDSGIVTGGFVDPVFQSQAIFREVLDAFSRPGTIVRLPAAVGAPAPLYLSSAALLATLADEDTSVYLDRAEDRSGPAAAWIAFHTGAPVAHEPGASALAVVTSLGAMPSFDAFALGSQEYPDRSTTIVLQIDDLTGGPTLAIEGPGIRGRVEIGPVGLPGDFVARM